MICKTLPPKNEWQKQKVHINHDSCQLTKFNNMTKFNTKFVPSVIQSPMSKFNQNNYAVNKGQTFIVKYSKVDVFAIQFMQSAQRFTVYIKVNAYTIQLKQFTTTINQDNHVVGKVKTSSSQNFNNTTNCNVTCNTVQTINTITDDLQACTLQ